MYTPTHTYKALTHNAHSWLPHLLHVSLAHRIGKLMSSITISHFKSPIVFPPHFLQGVKERQKPPQEFTLFSQCQYKASWPPTRKSRPPFKMIDCGVVETSTASTLQQRGTEREREEMEERRGDRQYTVFDCLGMAIAKGQEGIALNRMEFKCHKHFFSVSQWNYCHGSLNALHTITEHIHLYCKYKFLIS